MDNNQYEQIRKKTIPKPKYLWNVTKAFLVGGLMGVIAELLIHFYANILDISLNQAVAPMIVTVIAVTCILTGLGWFKKIGQFSGAGTLIPITGFANSVCSEAIEYRREGLITGIGSNIFKLAGSVLTYGIVSSAIFATIRYYFF